MNVKSQIVFRLVCPRLNSRFSLLNLYNCLKLCFSSVTSLFTSYKQGWKTDKGMIYIIFGAPDEVLKDGEREENACIFSILTANLSTFPLPIPFKYVYRRKKYFYTEFKSNEIALLLRET